MGLVGSAVSSTCNHRSLPPPQESGNLSFVCECWKGTIREIGVLLGRWSSIQEVAYGWELRCFREVKVVLMKDDNTFGVLGKRRAVGKIWGAV